MTFTATMDHIAQGFEAVAVLVLVGGLVWAGVSSVFAWRAEGEPAAYRRLRQTFGNALLLGLEIFVAADLIRTVAVDLTLESVAALGVIVLIRTFLSISLDVEIEGVLPWRRGPRK